MYNFIIINFVGVNVDSSISLVRNKQCHIFYSKTKAGLIKKILFVLTLKKRGRNEISTEEKPCKWRGQNKQNRRDGFEDLLTVKSDELTSFF